MSKGSLIFIWEEPRHIKPENTIHTEMLHFNFQIQLHKPGLLSNVLSYSHLIFSNFLHLSTPQILICRVTLTCTWHRDREQDKHSTNNNYNHKNSTVVNLSTFLFSSVYHRPLSTFSFKVIISQLAEKKEGKF